MRTAPIPHETMRGWARVYFSPEPPEGSGPHLGVRGVITVNVLGVHLDPEVEWLYITYDAKGKVTGSEWEPMSAHTRDMTTLPWHRIHSIEWEVSP